MQAGWNQHVGYAQPQQHSTIFKNQGSRSIQPATRASVWHSPENARPVTRSQPVPRQGVLASWLELFGGRMDPSAQDKGRIGREGEGHTIDGRTPGVKLQDGRR